MFCPKCKGEHISQQVERHTRTQVMMMYQCDECNAIWTSVSVLRDGD